MPVEIRYKKAALKGLRKMPVRKSEQLIAGLKQYAQGNSEGLVVEKLAGREGYKLKIHGYRAIFQRLNGEVKVLEVLKAGPRGGIYQ